MNEINQKIDQLEKRLEDLVKTQISFQSEITQIRNELAQLKQNEKHKSAGQNNQTFFPKAINEELHIEIKPSNVEDRQTSQKDYEPNFSYTEPFKPSQQKKSAPVNETQLAEKSNIEKFIGENLLSKIGIVILVLGVAIGAKYAIDNNLISPLMRIVLGYICGFGLLGFAFKLKEKYLSFSAVLLSGAMAIMYFITFFAYGLYEIFPQTTAFVLMLIFTIFTVASALLYNRQVIAQIGLVGAYAIPFLLSNNSGNVAFLFTYIAIINIGILVISIKKYWKSLHFSSFIVTWLIFSGWFITKYSNAEHFQFALLFLAINFLTFYITFIVYKIINLKNVALENISLILANSFIFYGFGYVIFEGRNGFEDYLGIFTIANAGIHFLFAIAISRLKIVPKDLVYLLSALIITFTTIAVPVQIDGNFVTLIWTVEAAILFWIGRTKAVRAFEIYSFPLMFLASMSLLLDWSNLMQSRNLEETSAVSSPFYNGTFFTSLFFAAAFFFIYLTNKVKDFSSFLDEHLRKIFGVATAVIFLFVLYNSFRLEISNYFQLLTLKTSIPPINDQLLQIDESLGFFNILWQINYSMLFLTVLSAVNISKVKSPLFALVNVSLQALTLFIFITVGLGSLSELREIYLSQTGAEIFSVNRFHLLFRYVCYTFVGGLFLSSYFQLKQTFFKNAFSDKIAVLIFDMFFYISLLIIATGELLNLTSIYGYNESDKLGLSILWGIYALVLIIIGIYKHKKHLRISAIVLFGITLAKLFFYDISNLDTISKTIVFVSLGILLLIVSFLYNKYKSLIFD